MVLLCLCNIKQKSGELFGIFEFDNFVRKYKCNYKSKNGPAVGPVQTNFVFRNPYGFWPVFPEISSSFPVFGCQNFHYLHPMGRHGSRAALCRPESRGGGGTFRQKKSERIFGFLSVQLPTDIQFFIRIHMHTQNEKYKYCDLFLYRGKKAKRPLLTHFVL